MKGSDGFQRVVTARYEIQLWLQKHYETSGVSEISGTENLCSVRPTRVQSAIAPVLWACSINGRETQHEDAPERDNLEYDEASTALIN